MQPDPNAAKQLFAEAARAHRDGLNAEVARLCREVLARVPGHVGALLMLSEARENEGDLAEAAKLADAALALAPDNVTAWNKRGALFGKTEQLREALSAFERAHELEPQNAVIVRNLAQAHFLLGQFQDALDVSVHLDGDVAVQVMRGEAWQKLGDDRRALASFEAAAAGRPRAAKIHHQVGSLRFKLGLFEGASASFQAASEIHPQNATTLSNLGLALTEQGRYAEALEVLNRAIAIEPDNALARWHRSLVLLVMGDLAQGFHDYEARFRVKNPTFEKMRRYDAAPWMPGDDIAGKTVFLYCGQGLGDTIQFVRYAPLLVRRGARVILEVQRSLRSLLERLGPDITVVAQGEAPGKFDMYCPMASIPFRFGTELGNVPADVPYIAPDRVKCEAWRRRLSEMGPRPKVGVAWAGNAQHVRDAQRSLALRDIRAWFANSAISFVSLQKEMKPGDAETLAEHPNVLVVADELRDFSDTAAVVANLDLVVSIDSSIAHLAGALGRPFWLLTPFAPDWRWLLERTDSPWYPTARLFRQPGLGEWAPVVRDIDETLKRLSRDGAPFAVAG